MDYCMKNALIIGGILFLAVLSLAFVVVPVNADNVGPDICGQVGMERTLVISNPTSTSLVEEICRPISQGFCRRNRPTGTCTLNTPNANTCIQHLGGACVYSCTTAGTYNDGAVCSSGYCSTTGTSCQP